MIDDILISYVLLAIMHSHCATLNKMGKELKPRESFIQQRTSFEEKSNKNSTTRRKENLSAGLLKTNSKFVGKFGDNSDITKQKESLKVAGVHYPSISGRDFGEHSLLDAKEILNRTGNVGQIVIHLTADRISIKHIQTQYLIRTEDDANESIEFLFDDLQNNMTNNTLGDGPIQIIPVCQVGDKNCTKCKAISPLCHFMYSEGRCVFHNSTHASKLYECANRWFPVDKNEPFIATFVIVILISAGIAACFVWIRLHQVHGHVDVLPADELSELRQLIDAIRKKRQRGNQSGATTENDQPLNNNRAQSIA